jgi:hypothetical protein
MIPELPKIYRSSSVGLAARGESYNVFCICTWLTRRFSQLGMMYE